MISETPRPEPQLASNSESDSDQVFSRMLTQLEQGKEQGSASTKSLHKCSLAREETWTCKLRVMEDVNANMVLNTTQQHQRTQHIEYSIHVQACYGTVLCTIQVGSSNSVLARDMH